MVLGSSAGTQTFQDSFLKCWGMGLINLNNSGTQAFPEIMSKMVGNGDQRPTHFGNLFENDLDQPISGILSNMF